MLLLAGTLLHVQILLLLPSYLWLVVWVSVFKRAPLRAGPTAAGTAILALAAAAGLRFVPAAGRFFLPLIGPDGGYGVFSGAHLLDVINQVLLLCPMWLVFAVLILRERMTRVPGDGADRSVIPALLKLVEKAFSNDTFEKTHLNFALYRLGILHNSSLNFDKTEVIENIRKSFVIKPHHSGLFCDFLSLFPNDEEIPKFLISFLKSKDNIYEWQELKVLQSLLRFNFKAKQEEIDFLLDSARNSNKHSATRAFYFLLAGKHGSNRDRNLIIDSYNSLSDLYTKIAIILSVQELGIPTRNDFYTRTKRSENNKEINQFVEYVKSLSNPIYFLTTQRPKIETYEQFEKPFYESM